jgi:hypothetical protein
MRNYGRYVNTDTRYLEYDGKQVSISRDSTFGRELVAIGKSSWYL